jgi:YesN/AraC family two-component response regulator
VYSLIIVDDEPVLRDGLARHFPWEKYGFRVRAVFASSQQALSFFERDTADALLTDIRMPFMSGLDLVRRIREDFRNRTVMCLISAYKDFAYAQEGMALGIKYYLVKPTSFEEIGEVFQKIRQELDGQPAAADAAPETDNETIRQACAIVRARTGACTLNGLAAELGLDSSYLSRLFKKETGENFRDYLRRVKMEQAAQMLLSPINYRNKDISEALGYLDAQNFFRAFREYYGMNPSEYRRRERHE